MRGWGGGWEGMCSQWPWACSSFIILLSSLTSSVLCKCSCAFWPSSVRLILIHWLWEHRQNSSPLWGIRWAWNDNYRVLFFGFLFLLFFFGESRLTPVNTIWIVEHCGGNSFSPCGLSICCWTGICFSFTAGPWRHLSAWLTNVCNKKDNWLKISSNSRFSAKRENVCIMSTICMCLCVCVSVGVGVFSFPSFWTL